MEKKIRQVAIVHYNTPELTEAAILSLKLHGGEDYNVTVFDNSDRRPFTKAMDGVQVIDNTSGQVIDFDAELAKYPEREPRFAMQSNYGSFKHILTIQKLFELLPDGFLLMESDIIIKQSVDHMFDYTHGTVGHIQTGAIAHNPHNIDRLVPFLCFINVPMCRKCGVSYFDPMRCWALQKGEQTRGNWYDTGASFLEDIRSHKNGINGLRIDIRPLMDHYHGGSWKIDNLKQQLEWITQHRQYWADDEHNTIDEQPDNAQVASKDVAVCIIVRCENPYLREWCDHYMKLGVKKIFLYDNSREGDERPAEVMADYGDAVEIIDYTAVGLGAQVKAYTDCYMRHWREYGWIGFLDADELVNLEGMTSLPHYLSLMTDDEINADVVVLSWRIMTDSGLTHYDPRPMAERFTVAKAEPSCDNGCEFVKSFVRGGLFGLDFHVQPHVPHRIGKLKVVNAVGQEVRLYPAIEPVYKFAWIDHYLTKTAEEYVGKIGRGFINVSQEHNDKRKATMVEDFFNINERTPEKEAILRGEKYEPEPEPEPVLEPADEIATNGDPSVIAPPTFDEAQGTPAPSKASGKPKMQKRKVSKKQK